MKKANPNENEILSPFQKWYWKNPARARKLQRAKYKRNPERIKASIKSWQERNPEHWKILSRFNARIYYWRVIKNDPAKATLLEAAKKTALRNLAKR